MKITEAAQTLRTSAWTLRYYEQVGLIGPVMRRSKMRDYSPANMKQLREILALRDCGVTIEKIKQFLALQGTADAVGEQQQLLTQQASELQADIWRQQRTLDQLHAKIEQLGQTQPVRQLRSCIN